MADAVVEAVNKEDLRYSFILTGDNSLQMLCIEKLLSPEAESVTKEDNELVDELLQFHQRFVRYWCIKIHRFE